jgi:hypothetical protein
VLIGTFGTMAIAALLAPVIDKNLPEPANA